MGMKQSISPLMVAGAGWRWLGACARTTNHPTREAREAPSVTVRVSESSGADESSPVRVCVVRVVRLLRGG